uniref:EGF-like domain-containing protein n=1 Tax=Elaeophora elaphi TaxID=1147741 RepID=A0A0R3RSW8_9BILA
MNSSKNSSIGVLASTESHCKLLLWDKGIPNTVECDFNSSKWFVDGREIDTTNSTYRKIYGYVPNGGKLYVYHPIHNQIITCSNYFISYCYRINLKRCEPKTCQNNGRCKMADSKTPIERVTCICKHLSKGYKCSESYRSMAWVTVLLWLAVLFEIMMIIGAIYRNHKKSHSAITIIISYRNQKIYEGVIHRRFVDIIGEPKELFQ